MNEKNIEILGFQAEEIFFRVDGKIIILKDKLTKQDLILRLGVEPEDVKAFRDEILYQASKLPIPYDKAKEFRKIKEML